MHRVWLASIWIAASACDDGWHEGDPVDRSFTAWNIVASLDEQRAAVILEPRKIHRDERGVLTLGYQTATAGPSIAVALDTSESIGAFATGATSTVIGATRAWVLQSEVVRWEHMLPSAGPPRAPFVRGTVVDRATLGMAASFALAPPIETPIAIGDDLLDLPTSGSSDFARDVFVRRREADGGATVLHAGRGFASAFCARGDGLLLAYQLEAPAGDLRLVSVRREADGSWAMAEATFAATRFDPAAIACDAAATRAALAVASGVVVLDVATASVALEVPGARPPMALRGDGTAIVATRAADRMLVTAGAGTSVPTGLISLEASVGPALVGDLAMFFLEDSAQVIDLADGQLGPAIPGLGPSSGRAPSITAWTAGGAFVVELSRFSLDDTDYHLDRLLVVDRTGTRPLPVAADLVDPRLLRPAGSRLYLRAQLAGSDEPHLLGFDLAARTQVSDALLPLCDEAAVLEERGCR